MEAIVQKGFQYMKLRITEKSLKYLQDKRNLSSFINNPIMKIQLSIYRDYNDLEFEDDSQTVRFLIFIIANTLFEKLPDENNTWVAGINEYKLNDVEAIREILIPFECIPSLDYPLSTYRLNETIKDRGIKNLDQAIALDKDAFSSVLPLGGTDFELILQIYDPEDNKSQIIELDHPNLDIHNRHIPKDFRITGGSISFENCIIEGDLSVSNADSIVLSQCIVLGEVRITGTEKVSLNFSNIEQLLMYNCDRNQLVIEFSKIYRFQVHSSEIAKIVLYKNKFVEPYLANVKLPKATKIDMDQFVIRNINHRIIKRISKTKKPQIKDRNKFFLTYAIEQPLKAATPDDIAFDMAEILLKHGAISKDHDLYANMMYEKVYLSNHGWRKLLVAFTGAFYKPLRWVLYLGINTLLFALLYTYCPALSFINTFTAVKANMGIWTAVYFSICQIIGANPTNYSPTGLTQLFVALQAITNTVIVANFAGSFVRKYYRISY